MSRELTIGQWLYVTVICLILLFAVLSNGLVIYCVATMRKLRSVTNVLIGNLAVSDILLGGIVMPMRVHDISHTDRFYEGRFICKFVNFSPVFVITSSVFTLVCISVERRRAIKESHKRQMTFSSLKKIIGVLWISSFLVCIPTIAEYDVNLITIQENGDNSSTRYLLTCGSHHTPMTYSMANAIFVVTISYVLPVVIMLINYIQVALFVWRKGRQVRATFAPAAGSECEAIKMFNSRIRIVKLLVAVAIIFAVSWLPFFIILLYAKITHHDASEDASGFLNLFLVALAAFSTASDVVLYVIFNPSFARAIRQVLRCCDNSIQTDVSAVPRTQTGNLPTGQYRETD